jgi:organic radical activating enzyme
MKKVIKVVQADTAPFNLTWVINNICTNQCSYCPPALHNGANHHYEWDNARRFFKELFTRYPRIHCSVAGGEPSLSPFLEELVSIFNENNSTIGITSNAAKPVSYWQRMGPDLNYICFSWHAEFIDKNFREKVMSTAMNTATTVRIMMNPNHWERSVEEYFSWRDNPYVFVEPVRTLNWNSSAVDPSSYTYSPEQEQWFEDNRITQKVIRHLPNHNFVDLTAKFYFDDDTHVDAPNVVTLINNGQTNFNGYSCEAGLKAMFIDWRGKIYLSNCQIGGAIGTINEPEKVKWPTGPVICNKNLCHCASDVVINKWVE